MEKNTKIIIWVSSAVVLGAIAYAIYWYMNLPVVDPATVTSEGAITPLYPDKINNNLILSINDQSNSVIAMQKAINEKIAEFGYTTSTLALDGKFGKKSNTTLGLISNGTLQSGNVTVNKVKALTKMSSAPLFAPNALPVYPFLTY